MRHMSVLDTGLNYLLTVAKDLTLKYNRNISFNISGTHQASKKEDTQDMIQQNTT